MVERKKSPFNKKKHLAESGRAAICLDQLGVEKMGKSF